MNQEISKKLIQQDSSSDPALVLTPTKRIDTTFFKGKEIEGLSPSTLSNMLMSQSIVIPIVVMMLIIMAGASVISSMGLEKENKTLETLLTLPVRRSHIVIGKMVGSALVGMIMAAIYMIGFSRYMTFVPDFRYKSGGFWVGPGHARLFIGRDFVIRSSFGRAFTMYSSGNIC